MALATLSIWPRLLFACDLGLFQAAAQECNSFVDARLRLHLTGPLLIEGLQGSVSTQSTDCRSHR